MAKLNSDWLSAPVATTGFDVAQYESIRSQPCPQCGSTGRFTVRVKPRSNGPLMFKMFCEACGIEVKELRHAVTSEKLDAFTIPIGKYKGKTLAETPREYLEWAQSTWAENLSSKIKAYLYGPPAPVKMPLIDESSTQGDVVQLKYCAQMLKIGKSENFHIKSVRAFSGPDDGRISSAVEITSVQPGYEDEPVLKVQPIPTNLIKRSGDRLRHEVGLNIELESEMDNRRLVLSITHHEGKIMMRVGHKPPVI